MRVLSKFAAHSLKFIAPSALALGLTATSVSALTINDTFLSSITTLAPATVTTIEAAIQTASNKIASLFSNPITVNILYGGNPGLNGGASSQTAVFSGIAYSTWTGLLTNNASAHPANTILSTAVANLNQGNDANGARPIASDTVNLRALGAAISGAYTGYFNSSGVFVGGGSQLYDGVVTITPASYSISEIEHEINEILGGGGQGSQLIASGVTGSYGGLDLYRYSAAGTPSFTNSSSATAYFSVNGGVTNIVGFNQVGGGSDYGDFLSSPCQIQSAFVCGGAAAFSTASPEYAMLESIGYDPTLTPLPSTWLMLLSGFVGLGFFAYRGTKKNAAIAAA